MAIEVLNQGMEECQMVASCCTGGTSSTRK
ncbi:geopeptide [Trichlorobacter lovleyi]|nr:geopeptide [Trichlorobacter lovleyi]